VCLELHPGDTIRQAQAFFADVDLDRLLELRKEGWDVQSNLHFAFMSKNLYWIKEAPMEVEEYLHFWKRGLHPIAQVQRDETGFRSFFRALCEERLIREADVPELENRRCIEQALGTWNQAFVPLDTRG
jgi:hypothetical protein